eukprot:gene30228-biopygen16083
MFQEQAAAEKPIVIKGTGTYKRTFPVDHITGKVLIRGAASDNEVLLEQSRGKYTCIKLMRGLWEEPTGHSSGTFFPVAATAGVGVLWGSAGHCLMPANVWLWLDDLCFNEGRPHVTTPPRLVQALSR